MNIEDAAFLHHKQRLKRITSASRERSRKDRKTKASSKAKPSTSSRLSTLHPSISAMSKKQSVQKRKKSETRKSRSRSKTNRSFYGTKKQQALIEPKSKRTRNLPPKHNTKHSTNKSRLSTKRASTSISNIEKLDGQKSLAAKIIERQNGISPMPEKMQATSTNREILKDTTDSMFLQIIVNLRELRKIDKGAASELKTSNMKNTYEKMDDIEFESKMVDLIN